MSATGTVSVRETAGIPVRIDGLRATLTNAATGATTFVNDFTAADVAGHANGVNRIAAGGTLRVIGVGGHYDLSLSGAATLTVDVKLPTIVATSSPQRWRCRWCGQLSDNHGVCDWSEGERRER